MHVTGTPEWVERSLSRAMSVEEADAVLRANPDKAAGYIYETSKPNGPKVVLWAFSTPCM